MDARGEADARDEKLEELSQLERGGSAGVLRVRQPPADAELGGGSPAAGARSAAGNGAGGSASSFSGFATATAAPAPAPAATGARQPASRQASNNADYGGAARSAD